jgi:hypothetical protein
MKEQFKNGGSSLLEENPINQLNPLTEKVFELIGVFGVFV